MMIPLAQPAKSHRFGPSHPQTRKRESPRGVAGVEAPFTLLAMLLYVGFGGFLMFEWGGLGSAFARAIVDAGAAVPASVAAGELE